MPPGVPDDRAALDEARATTRRVARTFALACRLLPRAIREDVYRLYLVFRTLDDLVDTGSPAAAEPGRGRRALVRAAVSRGPREARILADVDGRHPLPRAALLDFCRGMRDDLEGRPIATEEQLDAYCHRVAGTVGIVMAAVLGTTAPADREAAALGQGDAADQHPARHRRGPRQRTRLSRRRHRSALRVAGPRLPRAAAARSDRPGRRALRRGDRRHRHAPPRPPGDRRRRRRCTARSCARSSATATAGRPAGRSCRGRASCSSPHAAASRPTPDRGEAGRPSRPRTPRR